MILSLLLYFKFTINIDQLQYSWQGAVADGRLRLFSQIVLPIRQQVVPVQIKLAVWHTKTSHWSNVDFETVEGFFF